MIAVTGAACGGAQRPARGGGQLVWGTPTDADTLDPDVGGNTWVWQLLRLSYEELVGIDDHLRLVPKLAESWRQTSPTTYVFTLRQGVRFANGRELTVDDVVGSLKRLLDHKADSVWAGQLGDVRSVSAVGARQVKVTLGEPRASFLAALAGPVFVLPMKELTAGTFDPKKELLGTGPFKVVAHTQGESWTFGRNAYYWRTGQPKIDRLVYRIMPDDAARTAALRNGTVDVTTFENPDAIRLLKGQAGVKTTVQATTDYYRLDVNARSSAFRDDRLREAVALSIDPERIRKVALGGVGRATAAVSVAFNGVCDPGRLPYGKPDPQRARQLVAEAGATGRTVEILTTPAIPMSSPIAQVIQQDLQQTGLKVRVVSLDFGAVTKRVYSGKAADFDLNVSWFAGYADPAMALTWWNPNVTGFTKSWANSDAQLNDLIRKSFTTPPGPARAQVLGQACQRIAQDANIIPLVSKDAIVAYRSDKIDAPIQPVEGYGWALRHIAEFGVR